VDGLREEWGGTVAIVQVNVHRPENRDLLNRLGVRFTPTFVLYDGAGQEAWRAAGVLDSAALRAAVQALS
jgi:thioredoxin-related protein